MRYLVRCNHCGRQFDASGAQGGQLRCYCGAVLNVGSPEAHDAEVVRCSACGAPRQAGSTVCSYCHADFTLHERDLDTMCPVCFARISNTARYCHHCGTEIQVEAPTGTLSEAPCPVCGPKAMLTSRTVGTDHVALLECGRCAGVWVGRSTFQKLVQRAGSATGPTPLAHPHPVQVHSQQGPIYRRCIVCHALMARRNFAHTSGVIIDVCAEHGIWFDADELGALLGWVRAGGLTPDGARAAAEETVPGISGSTTEPTGTAADSAGEGSLPATPPGPSSSAAQVSPPYGIPAALSVGTTPASHHSLWWDVLSWLNDTLP